MKLATPYLGLKLRTPLFPSASRLSEKLDNIKRMKDAGTRLRFAIRFSKNSFVWKSALCAR